MKLRCTKCSTVHQINDASTRVECGCGATLAVPLDRQMEACFTNPSSKSDVLAAMKRMMGF